MYHDSGNKNNTQNLLPAFELNNDNMLSVGVHVRSHLWNECLATINMVSEQYMSTDHTKYLWD